MAHLLIIELPGGDDADILQAAHARGDSFAFLSVDLGHYRRQPRAAALLAAAHGLIEVAPFDDATLERAVLDAHAVRPFDAVLCLVEIRLIEAARLAKRLGLPFLNPDSAALLRDKFSVRQRLLARGLPQPEFALAESDAEIDTAVSRLGLPVLIKPADGYGSQNIVVLRHGEDLDPLLSPLGHLFPCNADYGLGVRSNDRLLVERYMRGTLIGCDTFSADGDHRLLGVHEKLVSEPPSFALRGCTFTPRAAQHAAIERHVFALLDAVGFDWGAAHVELMLTAAGPRLVEINPRLVGARIPRLLACALGRSPLADLIALHAGEPAPEPRAAPAVAVLRWIVATAAGVLERVELPPWDHPAVHCAEVLKQPGAAVRPAVENADRLGYVMVRGPSRAEAEALADRFIADTRVHLRARQPAIRLSAAKAAAA